MEGPLAQELFEESRSIGFKYVVLVSDGDTKVLPYVKDTYGLTLSQKSSVLVMLESFSPKA